MPTEVSQEKAEQNLLRKYKQLYASLTALVAALNVLEPGGTLVDDIVITAKEGEKVQVAYIATPIQLTINTPERKFIMKVIEGEAGHVAKGFSRSNVEKCVKEVCTKAD